MAENEALRIASKYAEKVRSLMDPVAVYLYGSQVKGTANKYSDIDIAVIVNSIPDDYLKTVSALWKLTRSVHEDIEPVLLSAEDADSGFLQTVLRTGIAV